VSLNNTADVADVVEPGLKKYVFLPSLLTTVQPY
jgi:hypothetical protein